MNLASDVICIRSIINSRIYKLLSIYFLKIEKNVTRNYFNTLKREKISILVHIIDISISKLERSYLLASVE